MSGLFEYMLIFAAFFHLFVYIYIVLIDPIIREGVGPVNWIKPRHIIIFVVFCVKWFERCVYFLLIFIALLTITF
jgi:hypothetical protein